MKRLLVTRFAGGTPLWTSPEQICQPRNVTHRSDVYSFVCCLYDMLTGRPPFNSDEQDDAAWAFSVQTKHVNEAPPPLRTWNKEIPPALDQLVVKALAKSPDDRIPGCGEFERLLKNHEAESFDPKGPTLDQTGSNQHQTPKLEPSANPQYLSDSRRSDPRKSFTLREPSMEYDIFICYVHEDKKVAEKLGELLKSHGIRAWWDKELKIGQKIWQEIDKGLRNSRYGVIIISKHFFRGTS